jgi:hypothetical protein
LRRIAAGLLSPLAVAIVFAGAGAASADPVNWDQSFLLQSSGGIENPIIRVGLNPQPEPPALAAALDLTHPPDPGLTLRGFSNPQQFQLFLAVGLPAVQLTMAPVSIPRTNFASLGMEVFGTSATGGPGARMFDVFFDFSTSSGGIADGLSAVRFNPQPEPPAMQGAAVFGMNFSFTSLSDATVTLRVLDAGGTQLSFSSVPEPATPALLVGGLVVLGAWRRRLGPWGCRGRPEA